MEAEIRVLGLEHPETLISIVSLPVTYSKQGKMKEAEDLFVLAMQTRNNVLGHDHHDTLDIMADLVLMYARQGRLREAEVLDAQVIESYTRLGLV